jgi:glyoxylase-like metal-dependent hydrolase (beta-lactamase superfamily II)
VVGRWSEIGDGVVILRYPFLAQNIGLVIGPEGCLVIDSRSSAVQAGEIQADVRAITPVPICAVINTHGHSDHVFGNQAFRPLDIWGHAGCVPFLAATGEEQRREAAQQEPAMAAELDAVVIEPPNRLVERTSEVVLGGRPIELRVPGRGHTDHDLAIVVPDADVVFAGDLIVRGDAQFFGHAYPLDWPASLSTLDALDWSVLVTGHGREADRPYLTSEIARHRQLVALATAAHAQHVPWEELIADTPYPAEIAGVALARTFAQLDGAI